MGYSNKLTEEEEMLQKKFAKLRKKKKMIQQLRQSKSNPQTPTTPQPKATKRPAETSQEDARELAKKVLAAQHSKSNKPENKEKGFKRSRNLERQRNQDKPVSAAPSYKPFDDHKSGLRGANEQSSSPSVDSSKKSLYDSFVSSGTLEDEKRGFNQEGGKKQGHTIFVTSPEISEDLCKQAFSRFGTMANVSLEVERKRAFITFDKMEDADKAIEEMNGTMVNGMTVRVAMARRQPSLEAVQNNTNSPWTKIAGGITKTRPKDSREVVVYDNDDPFA
ncbi:negative elongation factor E-like [Strongylocentrotus purpuratus]|uniref:Negative elongation factor E n=1 Tax=Strongylocentrotus purpuratus TaxID=7668 RepID=A0A7M7PNB1_STRPU|nr:negative elongation factor E-like [Strongylocentrotus purpuratus]|eukprot:XP_789598.2 PREDICTED: negative elongation factor E [Strongylocentrotus purpuratus]